MAASRGGALLLLVAALAGVCMDAFIAPGGRGAHEGRQVAAVRTTVQQRSLMTRGAGDPDLGPLGGFIQGASDYTKGGSKSGFPWISFLFFVFTIGLIAFFLNEGGKGPEAQTGGLKL
mmetsp:Transcript_87005/g.202550  ORF Transcript_87005/g.202550 Transcript_87005/m.202550 type:complete len:118 (-) Transcript_87005:62-415(-)